MSREKARTRPPQRTVSILRWSGASGDGGSLGIEVNSFGEDRVGEPPGMGGGDAGSRGSSSTPRLGDWRRLLDDFFGFDPRIALATNGDMLVSTLVSDDVLLLANDASACTAQKWV